MAMCGDAVEFLGAVTRVDEMVASGTSALVQMSRDSDAGRAWEQALMQTEGVRPGGGLYRVSDTKAYCYVELTDAYVVLHMPGPMWR